MDRETLAKLKCKNCAIEIVFNYIFSQIYFFVSIYLSLVSPLSHVWCLKLPNFTSKIRFTNKCRKLFQKSMMTFKSYFYPYVSWENCQIEFLFVSGTVINSIEDTRLDKPTPTGRDGGRRDIAPERKVRFNSHFLFSNFC